MKHEIEIVEVRPTDHAAIAAMTVAAFAKEFGTGEMEAALVAALRAAGNVVVELAALDGEAVVGHILFSRVADKPFTGRIAALAPMCVRGERQKSGIGSALVRAGLAKCHAQGIHGVVVFGDPGYYGRFGFSVGSAANITCAYAGPHFQALALEPGGLSGVVGVTYAPAFAAADV